MNLPRTNLLTARPLRRSVRRRVLAVVAWCVGSLALLSLVAIASGLSLLNAARGLESHAEAGWRLTQSVEMQARSLRFADALADLDGADREFAAAQVDLLKLRMLSSVPQAKEKLAAASGLLDASRTAFSAVRPLLVAADSAVQTGILDGEITDARKRQLLTLLYGNAAQIDESAVGLDSAIAKFRLVDGAALGDEVASSLPRGISSLESLRSSLGGASVAANLLPALLGYPEVRRYLLFFQNHTELRPTGGFLGVYGLAEVEGGRLVSVVTDDIYALDGPSESTDRPVPPEPIRRYISIDKWYLRDANWSPDFPTSVGVMERLFHEEASLIGRDVDRIDGVIALTPELVADLLRITGPITVDGKTFHADNLVDELEFQVEQNYIAEGLPSHERKDIIGDLADELQSRLLALPLSSLPEVAAAVEANLAESQLLLWFGDPDLQGFVLERDWGGQLQPVVGDYLSVIDANLASFKSDPVVGRRIAYSVSPADGGRFRASVSVTYDHRGRFDWKTTRYRTYVRVYVPAGSELLGVDGAMVNDKLKDPARRPGTADTYSELGRTAFGAFVSTEPGERRTITFRYLLPPSVGERIAAGEYRLLVEKQPGTVAHGLTLDLDFGKNLTSAEPAESPSEFGDSRFRYDTDLLVDRHFSVGLVQP
ncbi:MAG: DUF4012 domain-containing protein [bacterium]